MHLCWVRCEGRVGGKTMISEAAESACLLSGIAVAGRQSRTIATVPNHATVVHWQNFIRAAVSCYAHRLASQSHSNYQGLQGGRLHMLDGHDEGVIRQLPKNFLDTCSAQCCTQGACTAKCRAD